MQDEQVKDHRWLLLASLLIMAITTVPYIIAYSHNDTQLVYTGFVFGVEDGNSYIAKMLSGAHGAWLFRSPYSVYSQRGFLAFFPYLLLGKLSAPPAQHEQLVFYFHLFRWAAGIFLIFTIYRFAGFFLHNRHERRMATVIAAVGGGLGWLSALGLTHALGIQLPLEFYSPETFGFLSIFGLPHLAAARGLLLLGLVFFLNPHQSARTRTLAALSWCGLGFFQPLTIVSGWAMLGGQLALSFLVHAFARKPGDEIIPTAWKESLLTAMVMVGVSIPWVAYNFFSFSANTYLSGWAMQNIITSPPPLDYLFSFALILPFSVTAAWYMLKGRLSFTTGEALLLGYTALFPALAYAPHNLQRRLPEGIWVFLVVLGFLAVARFRPRLARICTSMILACSLLSSMVVLAGGIQVAARPAPPLFRSAGEVDAFLFLADNAPPGSVVAASFSTSNAMPAWAPVSVLTGHGPESINRAVVEPRLSAMFAGAMTQEQVVSFLNEFSVDYIFWGPAEGSLGNWNPSEASFLELFFDRAGYQVYRVSGEAYP